MKSDRPTLLRAPSIHVASDKERRPKEIREMIATAASLLPSLFPARSFQCQRRRRRRLWKLKRESYFHSALALLLPPASSSLAHSVLPKFSCRFWRAHCGVRPSLFPPRFSHDRMAEVPLRVTRFALRHCTTSTSHPRSTSPLSLPTTTRRRCSPEFPFPSSHHFNSLRRFSWPSSSSSSLAAVDKLFPRRPPD